MILYPLGVGDAFARRHFSTALALEHAGRWLLVDCPHPIRRMMYGAAADIDVGDIDAVVLTHLHGDHVSGLEGLAFYNLFKMKRRTVLLASAAVVEELWDGHLACAMRDLMMPDGSRLPPMKFEHYFDHRPIEPGAATTIGPFTVTCRMTQHHIPTTAVRIDAGGASVAYSADTRFDPDLIDWLAQAQVIVHETNVAPHTPYADLMTLPASIRDRMHLVQYSDTFDTDASEIAVLREGQVLPIG